MTPPGPDHLHPWEALARASGPGAPAPDWPRPSRPLRIAMLGWAWLPLQEREGTGYNLVQSETALALAALGHTVCYLRSGISYSLRPGMHIRLRDAWRGVACFDLYNSPNLATADRNFQNIRDQSFCPEHTALVAQWCADAHADVVHIHSFEGFGFDLVAALKARGMRVVITPHNYYALCPQVDLMHHERSTCADYDGGRRCAGCIPSPVPAADRRRRAWEQSLDRALGPGAAQVLRHAPGTLRRRLSEAAHPAPEVRRAQPHTPPTPHEVLPPSPCPSDTATDVHLRVLHPYGERRLAGVAALNAADAVLCPGATLLRIHRSMGVSAAKLAHVPLGLPHLDTIANGAAQDTPPWHPAAARPLRLAYLGSSKPNKGLATLCQALRTLPAAPHFECEIHASGDTTAFRDLLREAPRVRFFGHYRPADAVSTALACDVGLFPNQGLENCPIVLLEFLAAGRPVLASRLGASLDWVHEGVTGYTFSAGDPASLADVLAGVLAGRLALPGRRTVRAGAPVPSFAHYLRNVLAAYDAAP